MYELEIEPDSDNEKKLGGLNLWNFFNSAVDVLQTLVVALGAGLGIWGGINLMEGYGNDNPGAKSQGMKQLYGGRRRCPDRHDPCTTAFRPVRIMTEG